MRSGDRPASGLPEHHDVWGALLADVLAGKRAMEIVERDDGYIMAFDAGYFIAPFKEWDDPIEQRAMRFVRGRVLDVGCGGGRVCLYLQERGFEVVCIDSSPGAIECYLRRGVQDARVLSIDSIDTAVGQFDTIVFLGQNFGMLGSRTRARRHSGAAGTCHDVPWPDRRRDLRPTHTHDEPP